MTRSEHFIETFTINCLYLMCLCFFYGLIEEVLMNRMKMDLLVTVSAIIIYSLLEIISLYIIVYKNKPILFPAIAVCTAIWGFFGGYILLLLKISRGKRNPAPIVPKIIKELLNERRFSYKYVARSIIDPRWFSLGDNKQAHYERPRRICRNATDIKSSFTAFIKNFGNSFN